MHSRHDAPSKSGTEHPVRSSLLVQCSEMMLKDTSAAEKNKKPLAEYMRDYRLRRSIVITDRI